MPRREIRDGVTQYHFGESALMPEDGKPFHMVCGTCNTTYALTHDVDHDGRVDGRPR